MLHDIEELETICQPILHQSHRARLTLTHVPRISLWLKWNDYYGADRPAPAAKMGQTPSQSLAISYGIVMLMPSKDVESCNVPSI